MKPLANTPAEKLALAELLREYGSTPFDIRLIARRAQKYELPKPLPPLPTFPKLPPLP